MALDADPTLRVTLRKDESRSSSKVVVEDVQSSRSKGSNTFEPDDVDRLVDLYELHYPQHHAYIATLATPGCGSATSTR